MAGIRLTKLDLFLAICILAFDLAKGDVPTKFNLEYACPNLNCTVTWDPPANTSVKYTVAYTSHKKYKRWKFNRGWWTHGMLYHHLWTQKDECANTPLTFCHFAVDFNNVHRTWHVRVKAAWSSHRDKYPFKNVMIKPYSDATLGAAEITNISTTSRSISLHWLSPLTPRYFSNGTQKRMSFFYSILYSITYCIPFEPSSCVYVDTGPAEFVTLSERIFPWTEYEITLKGKIRHRDDGDSVTVTVTTDKEGVTLNEDWQVYDCDYSPNKRNISISWEGPGKRRFHGKLQRYEMHFWVQETKSDLTIIERNLSDTNFVLEDMSRWQSLNIDVYTCDSVGCTGSANPIRLNAAKVVGDAPPNVSAFETSSSSFSVTWLRPDNDECIKSYNVRYTSEFYQGEKEVTDHYAHITNVPSGTEYTVSVSANVYKGYNSIEESEPRSTTVRLLDENRTTIKVTAILVTLIILCFCTVFYCRKHRVFIYEHCFKSIRRKDFREHMECVLNDRPVAPSYDESFQYDTLNGILISTSTYNINASISVASVTESSPSTDTYCKARKFAHSSATVIKVASQNVPLPSLDDILISPPTPDDNSSSADIE